MASPADPTGALEADWLGLCRRCAAGVQSALERFRSPQERARTTGRGEGGDMTLALDLAAEDFVFGELESLGRGLTAVSEERGELAVAGGGPVHVVIDPIDGSLNAKRELPPYSLSIAVAAGATMGDVAFGYVYDLSRSEEWWARRGEGAFLGDERLPILEAATTPAGEQAAASRPEVLGLEGTDPPLVAGAADALARSGASRLRALGSIAVSLCFVAAGRLDAMLALGPSRSVDAAAGQLLVREVGGAVAFPDAGSGPSARSGDGLPLGLEKRSRIVAARVEPMLEGLLPVLG